MTIDYNELFRKAQAIVNDKNASHDKLGEAFDITTAVWNVVPKHPYVVFTLANIAARRKQISLSRLLYEIFLKLEPEPWKQAAGWLNLGLIMHNEGLRDESREFFKKAMDLVGDATEEDAIETKRFALLNLAGSYQSEGEPDTGIALLEEYKEKYPNTPEADKVDSNQGMLLLEKGDYENGFRLFSELKSRAYKRTYGDLPLWDGTKGKTVVVSGEQGIGDEIMFASMIPDAMKDCTIVMDAHLRLADMFRRSFNTPIYGTRELNCLYWFPPKDACRIPIGDLGKFYRKKPEDFPKTPYLYADETLVKKAKAKLGELPCQKPCIGISWKGGTKETNKQHRNVGLERLIPLLKSIDANWISLQYKKDSQQELDEFCGKTGLKIHHWQDWVDDYDMTAALVKSLDLVISVPQSVVHLAGAIGTPTWQLCPKKAMWQMGPYGQEMPWYGCAKNYWQGEDGQWEPVIEQVRKDLEAWNLLQTTIAA